MEGKRLATGYRGDRMGENLRGRVAVEHWVTPAAAGVA